MKRYLSLFIVLAGILMVPKPSLAQDERPGDLFKAPEFSAVYMVGNDGKRHVFPIEAVYKNWYGENWSLHRTLPLPEVSNWMLGRNIVYRPGTLVKIPSVPKVYLVKEVSIDHDLAYIEWIPTEAEFLARGFKFRDIKDLPEPFFPGHYVELANNNPQVNAQAAENGNDFDNDTIPDVIDNCPINSNTNQADLDSDRVGDICDAYDNRQQNSLPPVVNVTYPTINIPPAPTPQIIYVNQPPLLNNDMDGDGILNDADNCPNTPNSNQLDTDADGIGDLCDPIDNRVPVDADHDGLSDNEEAELGTNPKQADSDWDGLTDYDEVRTYRTDPRNPDTDGDGYSDGTEVATGHNPLLREAGTCSSSCRESTPDSPALLPPPGVVPEHPDADRDGLTDAEESRLGTNPYLSDSDWDGLSDYHEIRTYFTDPMDPDTDGDGYYDGAEVTRGTDPLKAG